MGGVLGRLMLGLAWFGGIEVVDHYVRGFSSPWFLSLVVGICLGFGLAEALEAL